MVILLKENFYFQDDDWIIHMQRDEAMWKVFSMLEIFGFKNNQLEFRTFWLCLEWNTAQYSPRVLNSGP